MNLGRYWKNDINIVTMINELLVKIGLSNDETSVYLATIVLGESTIAALSKKAELPRTTCYLIVNRLTKKGLLSQTCHGAHTYISPTSIENLRALVIEQEQTVKKQREVVDRLIPQLTQLSGHGERPQIQYFSGRLGIRAIFEDLLSSGATKDHYLGSTKKLVEIIGVDYMRNWMHRRVAAGIFSYGVRIKTEEMPIRTFQPSRRMMREIRYAPKNIDFPLYVCIYGDKVALVSSKTEGFGTIIESPDLAKTQKALFNILWSASSKP